MNMRKFYQWVSKKEGGKVNQSIAQISETAKWVLIGVALKFEHDTPGLLKLMNRYRKLGKKLKVRK